MRVLLDFADIQKALTTYVDSLGLPNSTGVELSANTEGTITAEVIFAGHPITDESPAEADVTETPKKRGRGGRPRGSKNLPKNEPKEDNDVGTPVQTGAAGSSEGNSVLPDGETPEESAPEGTDTKPAGTKKGNLFGDKESPSSEDNGQAEAAPCDLPEPSVTEDPPKKKGSIFDA